MNKTWWKSKTIWFGSASILIGIGGYLNGNLTEVQSIMLDLLGLMGIGLRDAIK